MIHQIFKEKNIKLIYRYKRRETIIKLRASSKKVIAAMVTLCLALGLLFTDYGDIATKAEETGTAPHTLQNPIKDGRSGNVIWDCVWFGNYPQTEIVSEEDETQLAAMQKMNTDYKTRYETVSASAYQQIAGASYDSNGDATVDGVKYRRMKKGDATHSKINNSKYYQWTDSTSYHYFRYEPIKWRVLLVEGNDALLLADLGLDDRKYNESRLDITWENSTMRSWLNGYGASDNQQGGDYSSSNFLDSAFSSAEQAAIANSTVVNADNPRFGTTGGNDTIDKIFLLSIDEATKTEYGFLTDYSTYDKARMAKTSTYAKAAGCWTDTNTAYAGNAWWWLRSPGYNTDETADVYSDGFLIGNGYSVNNNDIAVRPALHLNLSSSLYFYAGNVGSGGTMYEEAPPSDATTTEAATTTEKVPTDAFGQSTTTEASTATQIPNNTESQRVTAPARVKKVKLKKAGSGKLKVSFKKVKKAKGYQIRYSTNKRFSRSKKIITRKNKYTIKKLKKGKTYYVKVRAYKLNGSKKVYGKWSAVKKCKVKK